MFDKKQLLKKQMFFLACVMCRNRVTSVGTPIGLRAGQFAVRIPAEVLGASLLQMVQIGSGAHPNFYSMGRVLPLG